MRLTLEPTGKIPRPRYAPYARVVIEIDSDDLSLLEMLDDLIKPALLALQYPPALVQGMNYEEILMSTAKPRPWEPTDD